MQKVWASLESLNPLAVDDHCFVSSDKKPVKGRNFKGANKLSQKKKISVSVLLIFRACTNLIKD